jgi:hypothetical protein
MGKKRKQPEIIQTIGAMENRSRRKAASRLLLAALLPSDALGLALILGE